MVPCANWGIFVVVVVVVVATAAASDNVIALSHNNSSSSHDGGDGNDATTSNHTNNNNNSTRDNFFESNNNDNATLGTDEPPPPPTPEPVTLYVQYKNANGKNAILSATGLVGTFSSESTRFQAGSIQVQDANYKDIINKLRNNPDVEHVEIDHVMKKFPTTRTPRNLQGTVNPSEITYGMTMVQAPQVWDLLEDDASQTPIKICVVDTGYDLGHIDLPNQSHGIDGWSPSQRSYGVWDVDGDSHGTHCAGTIGAIGGNNVGVAGVNPNPNRFQFFIGKGLGDNGFGTNSNVMAAVEACADAGAKVISMSLGGGGFSSISNRIYRQVYDNGILVVAAAGNEGDSGKSYPASYPHVMSVAAVDANGNRAGFSQYNNQVEIAGPGVNVQSTVPNDQYAFFSGTSMATPHVAGVAALIWSIFPSCSNHQIRNVLLRSAQEPPGSAPCNNRYGHGIVNAKAAYDLIKELGCEGAGGTNPSPLSNGSVGGCNQGVSEDDDDNDPLPTPAPTASPACAAGTKSFQMELFTDNYPGETTWTLQDKNSQTIESGGPYNEVETIFARSACLDTALEPFIFTIFDSYQDGICCGHGSGSYRILYDGTQVASGGTFTASESITFPNQLSTLSPSSTTVVTDAPTAAPNDSPPPPPPTVSPTLAPQTPAPVASVPTPPVASCTAPNKEFLLKLKTDADPEETTWVLTVGPSGSNLVQRQEVMSGGPYEESRVTYEASTCLSPPGPDQVYTFTIRDVNGLRRRPRGRYEIFLDGKRLRRRNRFSISESVDFFPAQCFEHQQGSCDKLSRKFVCCTKRCRSGTCWKRPNRNNNNLR